MSRHTATFTLIKSPGQCLVRLQGPHATDAVQHEVTVTQKNGQVEKVKLTKLA